MFKGKTSVRKGIEDFLCPFTDMYITQGSNGKYSHKGTMANDVRGKERGVRYEYYAPCTCKCLKIYSSSGQAMWQSLEKVRFANGRIDYATFMTAHDESLADHTYIGKVIKQGELLGYMGKKGNATGVHCHIQIEQGNNTNWFKNEFGIYRFNNEYDTDDCYFIDDTNIINGMGGNWRYVSDVEVIEDSKHLLYETLGDMYVRAGAGTNYPIKLVEQLTADGQKHATSTNPKAYGVYRSGTVFTCYERIEKTDGSVWGVSPSGYICIKGASGREYCRQIFD